MDTPSPDFIIKMRGVVANSGMRALGLAPMNEELDDAVTVFLLAQHWLGEGGMGDPVIKCVQDSATTILAGLQHDSVTVRAIYENLHEHAGDRTRDIFSVQGDQTAARDCNSCGIMQKYEFTGGSNTCQRCDKLSGTSQAKSSAKIISDLVVRTHCSSTFHGKTQYS